MKREEGLGNWEKSESSIQMHFYFPLGENNLVPFGGRCWEQEALEEEGRTASSCGFQGSFLLAPPLMPLPSVFSFQLFILGET